jgi:hypothetical protein
MVFNKEFIDKFGQDSESHWDNAGVVSYNLRNKYVREELI